MRSPILAALVLLAACTRPAEPPGGRFAQELSGHVAGATQTCVATFPNQNLRVIDPQTLAYGDGRTIYVNHLAAACPALSEFNTVIAEVQGGQYCRGDRVRGLEPGGLIPGPSCNLGDWAPYRKP